MRNSGKRQGCLCRKTGSCVATRRWARQQARAGALGVQALGKQAGTRADARARGALAAGGRQQALAARACGGWALAGQAAGARGRGATAGAGRTAWALGAACAHGLGQLGARAPGLVSNLVFRLGIFPESPNGHCSL